MKQTIDKSTRIDQITFDNVLPKVFGDSDDRNGLTSGVWRCQCRFERDNIYMVEAASGAGKSSMCSFIFGNRDDYSGTILFNNQDIHNLSVDQWCDLRRRHIALLPQEMRLFPELSVRENIMLKNRLTDYCEESVIQQRLERFEILNKYNVPARLLSIGQQQRVAIVRALCQPFDFLLLDEPVSHLDKHNNQIAAAMVVEEAQRQQAAIIATSVGNPLDLPAVVPPDMNINVIKL